MALRNLPLRRNFEPGLWLVDMPRPFIFWLIPWLINMISLPIISYFYGETGLLWGVFAGVVLQGGAVLFILYIDWGIKRTAWVAGSVVLVAWAAEALGSSTGFPFGDYIYTDKLQPQIAHVPLLIPLAWFMMLPPAWSVAYCITGSNRGWVFIGFSALAFTAWDLFLDPQMVAWGFWVWEQPGGYFGIPWINYLGWLLTAALITALARPLTLPVRPLLLIYAITWMLETIGLLFFWNLPGPAVAGFVGMGIMIGWAWLKLKKKGIIEE